YGNRFFLSLAPLFVIGLSYLFFEISHWIPDTKYALAGSTALVLTMVVWNLGLAFQWGAHLIPVRGPVNWSQVAYNQIVIVPRQLKGHMSSYIFRRRELMHQIEERDRDQLRQSE